MRTWALGFLLATVALAADKPSILAVFAHPDDETIVGALLAKYASEGHKVHVLTLTSGQRGKGPNTNLAEGDELGKAREEEARCSARAMGTHLTLGGFMDGELADARNLEKAARLVIEKVNEFQPAILLTWGLDGVTGHPDHRAACNMTTQVFQQHSAVKHRPRKLYYIALSESQFAGAAIDGRRISFRTVSDPYITTWVDSRNHAAAAFAATKCHKTQWDMKRMEWNQQMFEKIQEGRISLRLAMTDIPFPRGKETGLFDGLEPEPMRSNPR